MSEKLGAGVLQRKTAEEESRPAVQALAGEHGGSRRPWGWATVMQICRLIIVGLLASIVSLASVGGLLSKVCFTSYCTSLKKLQPIVYGLYLFVCPGYANCTARI